MDDEREPLEWGLVPYPIVEVVRILASKVDRQSRHLSGLVWPEKPRDVQDLLRLSVSDAHKITRAGTDMRSLLTAYAHRFHEPKPVMAELARAQETSRQGIPRRYGEVTVAAIEELLSESPNTAVILHGLPSLALRDLEGVDGPVGEAAGRQLRGEEEFVSFSAQQRARRQESKEDSTRALSGLLPKRSNARPSSGN